MNKDRCSVFFIMCLFLTNCAENLVRIPAVFIDVEAYTADGVEAYSNGQWSKAGHFFNKALLLYQSIDHQEGVLLSFINLAEVSFAVHDNAKSKKYLRRATMIASYDLLSHYRSRITLLDGLVALKQKQIAEAERILCAILPRFEGAFAISKPDDTQLAAIAGRTKIAFLKKQEEALWTQRYASALRQMANKHSDNEARLHRFQAHLLLQQGGFNHAEEKLQQALMLYKKKASRVGIAITLFELAQLYLATQRWQEAQDYLQRSKEVYLFLKDNEKVKRITEGLVQTKRQIVSNK